MKKLLITLCSFGLVLGLAQGQMGDGFGDGSGGMEGPMHNMPPPLPEDLDPEVYEAITTLHTEIVAMRQALAESRAAALAELDDDATREERIAALTLWREENASTIEDLHTLTEELRSIIAENRPDRPFVEIPEEILALRTELRERRVALAQSRREAILTLGEDPTDEEIRAAIEAWRTENADEIAAVRALSQEIRDWFRENRPHRQGAFDTPRMEQRRGEFRENVRAMHASRQELRNQLGNPDLTEEERHHLIQNFREQQRELMRERQMLKRQERIDQGGVGGDRRPGG